jgi:predicted carbohydrate-binding protein with CBM5 and CBM33 domain
MIWNIAATLLLLLNQVQGHGYMVEPRSRNLRANQDAGALYESTPQGLNNRIGPNNQCGVPQEGDAGGTKNYDRPLASNRAPLPWQSQATYQQGSTITIRLYLKASHSFPNPGYFEFYACPRNQPLTEACFKQNRLTVVQGTSQVRRGNSWDANAPQDHELRVQLPSHLTGDVLIQWVWINTNSGRIPTVDPSGVEKFWKIKIGRASRV